MVDYSPPAGALGSYSRDNEKHSSANLDNLVMSFLFAKKNKITWEIVLL